MLSKKDIVFLQSDASYSEKNKFANISVYDTYQNKFYSNDIFKIKNSTQAEFYALIFSIKIANKNKYKNVIFVYDCKSLDINSLMEFCKNKCNFLNFQFLWLPRIFLLQSDELSRANLKLLVRKYDFNLTDEELIITYKKSDSRKILLSVFNYLDDTFINEKKVIEIYLENKYFLSKLQKIRIQNQDIFRFIYHMIDADEKQKFYSFFSTLMPTIENSPTFLKQPKKIFLAEILRDILSKLRLKKDILKSK